MSNRIEINVTRGVTNVVEIKAVGPQGQKGDTGTINASDITGSLTLSGSLTVSGSFVDFTNAVSISGSTFSGSFVGDGSGLTNIVASGTISSSAQIATDISGSFSTVTSLNRLGVGSIGSENAPVTSSYTVTVASKTQNHPYYDDGSGAGYLINGIESPYLNVYVGRSYKFNQVDNTNDTHPLRFYLDVDKSTAYTTNVSTSGTAGNAGALTQISITEDTPSILYYQCSAHGKMGNAIYVLGREFSTVSSSLSSRVTTLEADGGGIFKATGSIQSTTNDLEVTGSLKVTGTTGRIDSKFLHVSSSDASLQVSSSGVVVQLTSSQTFSVSNHQGQVFSTTTNLLNKVYEARDISGIPLFSISGSGLVELHQGDITGSATSTASFGRFEGDGGGLTNVISSAPAGTVSSSAQIATEISGAFTAASGGFSSRVTTLEAGGGGGGSGIFSATGSIQSTTNNLQVTGSLTTTGVITGDGSGLTNLSFTGKTYDQWDAMLPPTTANSLDDEFTSSLAGWSTYNTGSTPFTSSVDTVRRRLILEQNDLSGNDVLAGLYKSAPTASSGNYEYAVWTKTNLNTTDASNNPGAGLFVAEDIAVSASANVYAIVLQSWGSVYRTSFQTWSSFNNVTDTTTKYVYNKAQFQRIRVSYASSGNQSTVGFDFSEDGVGWFELDSATYSGHLPYIGLVVNNDASTKQLRGQFDYFRVYDDSTFSYVPSGSIKRIGLIGDQGDNFTIASASFSTRVTANEVVTAKTLVSGSSQITYGSISSIPSGIVSSSAQIATEISGAFTAASGGFSTRVTTLEAGGGGGSGIFNQTGSKFTTTNTLEITGSLTISGSTLSTASLVVHGSGSTIFDVQGSVGSLFSIDDTLSGSLLVASDISGLPQFEVFSNGEITLGSVPKSLYTTAQIASTTATTQSVISLSTSSYDAAFFDYVVTSASNMRAGNVMSVWGAAGAGIQFTETTTTDIGDTSNIQLLVNVSQSRAHLHTICSSAGWTIKTIVKGI